MDKIAQCKQLLQGATNNLIKNKPGTSGYLAAEEEIKKYEEELQHLQNSVAIAKRPDYALVVTTETFNGFFDGNASARSGMTCVVVCKDGSEKELTANFNVILFVLILGVQFSHVNLTFFLNRHATETTQGLIKTSKKTRLPCTTLLNKEGFTFERRCRIGF